MQFTQLANLARIARNLKIGVKIGLNIVYGSQDVPRAKSIEGNILFCLKLLRGHLSVCELYFIIDLGIKKPQMCRQFYFLLKAQIFGARVFGAMII